MFSSVWKYYVPLSGPTLQEMQQEYQAYLQANPNVEASFGFPAGITSEEAFFIRNDQRNQASGFIEQLTSYFNTGDEMITTTTVNWQSIDDHNNFMSNCTVYSGLYTMNQAFVDHYNIRLEIIENSDPN